MRQSEFEGWSPLVWIKYRIIHIDVDHHWSVFPCLMAWYCSCNTLAVPSIVHVIHRLFPLVYLDGLISCYYKVVLSCDIIIEWVDIGYWSNFLCSLIFPIFQSLWNSLSVTYQVYIWQVSLQLCCSDTCQIWTGFKGFNTDFHKIRHVTIGEIQEQMKLLHPPPQWHPLKEFVIFYAERMGTPLIH